MSKKRPPELKNWTCLTQATADLGRKELERLLKFEHANDRRGTFIDRLNQRLRNIAVEEQKARE